MRHPDLRLVDFPETGLSTHESFSPFCVKVHRALRYLALPYTVERSDPRAVRKLNPKGQLPVLRVGDEIVVDSTLILTRLEQVAGRSLSGRSRAEAAEARLWEELADGALYGFVVSARWADDDNWPRTREAYFAGVPMPIRRLVAERIRAGVVREVVARDVYRGGPTECWSRLEELLDDFDARAPSEGFFLGDTPTRADIALFAQLHSFRTDLTPAQRALVAQRPRLTAWLDRVDVATRAAS